MRGDVMKYVNAHEALPEELLEMVQKHFQGGYLYIPKENAFQEKRQTDYRLELEKRNQHIYLKHLEGRTNEQLGMIYHLSGPSVRRIISKEKVCYQSMREMIEQILPLWGIENGQLSQIYPSAWVIDDSYVIKVYDDKNQLERNIKASKILLGCGVPVAEILSTKMGEEYVERQNAYFLMSKKMKGSNISDIKDTKMAWEMGGAIARLHMAFMQCEKEIALWDNGLLEEMKGWVRGNLADNEWRIVGEAEYLKVAESLEAVYDHLPKQLIHRDVHFGNFLFLHGSFVGYIDFDLSQKNIRIFDICYFLTGLLAEETSDTLTKEEWLENVKAVIAGYERLIKLTEKEKEAIPWVMECVEILFSAYFIGIKDIKRANDAYHVFHFLQECEDDIKHAI